MAIVYASLIMAFKSNFNRPFKSFTNLIGCVSMGHCKFFFMHNAYFPWYIKKRSIKKDKLTKQNHFVYRMPTDFTRWASSRVSICILRIMAGKGPQKFEF